jgi:hypothetical protein
MPTYPESKPQNRCTPEQLTLYTPEQLAGYTPAQIARYTPQELARWTPEQLAQWTPEQLEEGLLFLKHLYQSCKRHSEEAWRAHGEE